MRERQPIPNQEHIPEKEKILPPIGLTVHKGNGAKREFTPEQLERDDEEWIIATTRPTGKSLGS